MELKKVISFIEEAELLKSVVRTAWTGQGRRESTAEHSWRLAMFAGIMQDNYPELDLSRILMMCLIHDIGEIYEGDVSAALQPDQEDKFQTEYSAAQKVFSVLPEHQAGKLMEIWLEYNEGTTPEARLVKALDKAETIIQHNQGKNPSDFNYEFNLVYGRKYFVEDAVLGELRSMLDDRTRENMEGHNSLAF
jgi:putative hydrolase of HD superfamily